jgi:formamidopyrimidine-DNA glycosylase
MPELPEVETTRCGLLPHLVGAKIVDVTVRDRRLRWPIPASLKKLMVSRVIHDVTRRGKYLLWDVESNEGGGFLLCHLGMSGSLFATSMSVPAVKHDHVDIVLNLNKTLIRYHDPRRFGAMLWIKGASPTHPLLDHLGPEPLTDDFDGAHLFKLSRKRAVSVKEFIMNSQVVVGVGNIYASEALFGAGIRPTIAAGRISRARYDLLANAIRQTLTNAIAAGGSSLRDYVKADGAPGYFQLQTMVYDRADAPCRVCNTLVKMIRQGQRSTYFCTRCQH